MLLTAIVRCQNYIMEGSCLIMNICVDAPNGDNKVSGLYNGSDICVNAPDSDRKGIRIICLKGYYWSWMFARMLLTATEKRQGRSCWVMDICAQSLITVGIELSNLGV
ncbi:uncharacterized protein OCT59_024392 [Rhizophagus irregularis]|uniref:Uncharacterized protein n=1 Tax=Rhizophagus irregularis TaxID=588596 RepID=A0A915YVY0_9GLOM|nr:hypothetical protein OCT59_024392 [Rhizophagus irregularis]CAB4488363.1 unnamed protein product [Rhizophagus irregularis]CAB5347138.1 unnamed protein product [Rhizophagus irregularis]